MIKRLTRGDLPVLDIGIVHFGPGAFFRAFNAIYTHEVISKTGGSWGICAVSLKSPTARDQLLPQGFVYTSVSLAPSGEIPEKIGSISEVLVAPEGPRDVLSRLADPSVKIVSLTITEKGYCHEPSSGKLRLDDQDILHDLRNSENPRTAIGFIVHALMLRKTAGERPFTVLSCDNLPRNGQLVREVVLDFAGALNSELAAWIAVEGRFPSTMVDRITPATTPDDIARISDMIGARDEACVVHEPFRQWVIEDSFVDGVRPEWELSGAQFVKSVEAHELMKLRCLNGTHSALAYLGFLAGYETVSDCMAEIDLKALCERLWTEEIIASVPVPEGEDLAAYCRSLLERYQNPSIRHLTWQIAADGSQKLPQRLLGTIRDNLETDRPIEGLCLAVAAWMRFVGGLDEAGLEIDVRDPLAARLRKATDQANSAKEKVDALLSFAEVFDNDLRGNSDFCDEVTNAYAGLAKYGAKTMIAKYVGSAK